MDVGVTNTQYTVDAWGNPAAVARGRRLLAAAAGYQNQSIYGWGTLNPEPAPGHFDWSSLDERVKLMRSMHARIVLTLCCAPDWMTAIGKDTSTYSLLAPTPKHYRDFAYLVKRIAERYPEVHYYQVWNEMKGFWDAATNDWDYVRYTRFYNYVYDALKSVNRHIKVGGPYLIVEGSGTHEGDPTQESPILDRDMNVINYWLDHAHGADFICLDRTAKADHDPLTYSPNTMLTFTSLFEDIARQIRARTNLPIWWSEERFAGGNWDYQAAGLSSILLHAIKGGSAVALTWDPQGSATDKYAGNYQNLFSDTRVPGGGQPFPYYYDFLNFHRYFGPGTRLYSATSSSPTVEVLASRTHTLLINKRPSPVSVRVNGNVIDLDTYQVKVIATPRQ
jgi:hypothetical protein